MNKARRKKIDEILAKIEELDNLRQDILCMVEEVKDEEQEAFDNMPESFQEGEKGEKTQEAIDNLESAYSALEDEMTDAMENLKEYLEEAQV